VATTSGIRTRILGDVSVSVAVDIVAGLGRSDRWITVSEAMRQVDSKGRMALYDRAPLETARSQPLNLVS